MLKIYFCALIASGLLGCAPKSEHKTVDSNLASVLMDKTQGCLSGPTEQFGRYIGDWDIQDWALSQTDGKTWTEGKGARWNFTCVGDGVAIQDFWMPNGGGVGTNLRMYDAKTERWEIAWTATGAPGFTHIRAKQDESGNIVMDYVSPAQNPPRRITFMPPTLSAGTTSWDWKLEMQFPTPAPISTASANEQSSDVPTPPAEPVWSEVYRIKATKRDN